MKNELPKCRQCSKKLPKQWLSVSWGPHLKREPIETRTTKAGTQFEHTEYFFGTYGRYNDGFFCSLRCGHRWAVEKLKGENK